MFSIADNLKNVRQRIQKATKAAARPEHEVSLLAVSKTQPAEALLAAIEAGQRAFGENYVQEAVDKQAALQTLCTAAQWQALSWHFIGPLQSNKTRLVAEHFDWVHSIDRIKIARRLSEQRLAEKGPLQVCLQVNIDDEASKAGVALSELPQLVDAVMALPNLQLRGLMTIPAATDDADQTRASFARMHTAFLELAQQCASVDTLSMGMSGDLELAVANGSTMVRVGTAIFGARH
ncbi:MAG: YggS family pyridoxal phosphate-dependent enzyme [Oleiphilaceae bacterium]|nr:YggS family pyridoxal phosphate-dependent enzyme [Oleiphilaceae bacterium]